MLAWSLIEPETDLRTDEHAGEQVREQQRLPEPVADERERRRDRNAYSDAGQKIHMLSHEYAPSAIVRDGSIRPRGRSTGCPS